MKLFKISDVFKPFIKFFRAIIGKRVKCHRCTHFRKDGCRIPVSFPCCDCNDPFRLNLAGLTENFNFQLLRSEGCDVEIDITFGATENKERGKIYNVGIDFIDLKKENGSIVTILKDKVSQIRWLDDECDSCMGETEATATGKNEIS